VANRFLYLARHGAAAEDGTLSEAGERQAHLTGRRLAGVPLSAIHHGPLPRAAQTARLIAGYLPGVPVVESAAAGDYLPSAPDPAQLPAAYAKVVGSYSVTERNEGSALAAAAIDRYAGPAADQDTADQDTYELIVTHNFLIGWLVRHALEAPDSRWLGLNQQNCALTLILYRAGLPDALVSYNDASHLPPDLRWTGFPAELRPAGS
jgi:serine/threonine-protein phosphatase PGAM5